MIGQGNQNLRNLFIHMEATMRSAYKGTTLREKLDSICTGERPITNHQQAQVEF